MSIAWTCVLIERNPTTGVETETAVPVDQEQIVLHGRETFVPVPLAWRNRLTTEQCLREAAVRLARHRHAGLGAG
jgi:hypothetical protein